MRQSVLSEEQAQFLREEKEALAGIQLILAGFDLPLEALDNLQKAILQLDELFLIVIVGEFNAGKRARILPRSCRKISTPKKPLKKGSIYKN